MIEQVAGDGDYTDKTIDSNGQLKIVAKDSDKGSSGNVTRGF